MAELYLLVFGEDDNDRRAVAELAKALAPQARIELRHRPMVLARNAHKSGKRRSMADDIAAFWKNAQRRGGITRVVIHRDCDSIENNHPMETKSLLSELLGAGIKDPIVAMPAWEIETWWMLFPEALRKTRTCWREVNYDGTRVGFIENAKERLRRDLRPTGQKARNNCRDYSEIDSLRVAKIIHSEKMIDASRRKKCASLDSFCASVEKAKNDAASA